MTDKESRFERLDKKYGDPYLREIAEKGEATTMYEMCVESQRAYSISNIEANVAYIICVVITALSALTLHTEFLVTACFVLVVATQASLNARVEKLWHMRAIDEIVNAYKNHLLKEALKENGGEK